MELLERVMQTPIVFIGGKGGVGKTTIASALAVQIAKTKRKTLIISTDPAHSLGDALGKTLSGDITPINDYLSALELDPEIIVEAHFKRIEATMQSYAKPAMMGALKRHLELAKHSPGGQEAALLEAMCHYLVDYQQLGFEQLIFDTAPTGHTLRLLMLPEMMQAWTEGMIAQHHKHMRFNQAMRALGDSPMQSDPRLVEALKAMNQRRFLFARAKEILSQKPAQAGVYLVMIAERLPFMETKRTVHTLSHTDIHLAGVIINQVMSMRQSDPFWQKRAKRQADMLDKIAQDFAHLSRFYLPLQAQDIFGEEALLALNLTHEGAMIAHTASDCPCKGHKN